MSRRSITRWPWIVVGTALALSGCGDLLSSETSATADTTPADPARLCPVVEKWRPALAGAESADLSALIDAKLGFYAEVRTVAPASWTDNIDIILPAWETLQAVSAQAAEESGATIDFAAFQRDFAESAANDGAFTVYTNGLCPPG